MKGITKITSIILMGIIITIIFSISMIAKAYVEFGNDAGGGGSSGNGASPGKGYWQESHMGIRLSLVDENLNRVYANDNYGAVDILYDEGSGGGGVSLAEQRVTKAYTGSKYNRILTQSPNARLINYSDINGLGIFNGNLPKPLTIGSMNIGHGDKIKSWFYDDEYYNLIRLLFKTTLFDSNYIISELSQNKELYLVVEPLFFLNVNNTSEMVYGTTAELAYLETDAKGWYNNQLLYVGATCLTVPGSDSGLLNRTKITPATTINGKIARDKVTSTYMNRAKDGNFYGYAMQIYSLKGIGGGEPGNPSTSITTESNIPNPEPESKYPYKPGYPDNSEVRDNPGKYENVPFHIVKSYYKKEKNGSYTPIKTFVQNDAPNIIHIKDESKHTGYKLESWRTGPFVNGLGSSTGTDSEATKHYLEIAKEVNVDNGNCYQSGKEEKEITLKEKAETTLYMMLVTEEDIEQPNIPGDPNGRYVVVESFYDKVTDSTGQGDYVLRETKASRGNKNGFKVRNGYSIIDTKGNYSGYKVQQIRTGILDKNIGALMGSSGSWNGNSYGYNELALYEISMEASTCAAYWVTDKTMTNAYQSDENGNINPGSDYNVNLSTGIYEILLGTGGHTTDRGFNSTHTRQGENTIYIKYIKEDVTTTPNDNRISTITKDGNPNYPKQTTPQSWIDEQSRGDGTYDKVTDYKIAKTYYDIVIDEQSGDIDKSKTTITTYVLNNTPALVDIKDEESLNGFKLVHWHTGTYVFNTNDVHGAFALSSNAGNSNTSPVNILEYTTKRPYGTFKKGEFYKTAENANKDQMTIDGKLVGFDYADWNGAGDYYEGLTGAQTINFTHNYDPKHDPFYCDVLGCHKAANGDSGDSVPPIVESGISESTVRLSKENHENTVYLQFIRVNKGDIPVSPNPGEGDGEGLLELRESEITRTFITNGTEVPGWTGQKMKVSWRYKSNYGSGVSSSGFSNPIKVSLKSGSEHVTSKDPFKPIIVEGDITGKIGSVSGSLDVTPNKDNINYYFSIWRSKDIPTLASFKPNGEIKNIIQSGIVPRKTRTNNKNTYKGNLVISFEPKSSGITKPETYGWRTDSDGDRYKVTSKVGTWSVDVLNYNGNISVDCFWGDPKGVQDQVPNNSTNSMDITTINKRATSSKSFAYKNSESISFYPYIQMSYQTTTKQGNSTQKQNANVLSEHLRSITPSDYVEAGYYRIPTSQPNLNMTSTQWSLHANAIHGDEWQSRNSVLPGGAIYTLDTTKESDRSYLSVVTWQTIVPDDIRNILQSGKNYTWQKAKSDHDSLAEETRAKIEKTKVVQWVNKKWNASTVFDTVNGVKVTQGGLRLSKLGTNNITNSESKYYLRDHTSSNKANEADIDVYETNNKYVFYTVKSMTNGDVVVYRKTATSAPGSWGNSNDVGTEIARINKTQGIESLLSNSELNVLDNKTKFLTNYLNAIERNTGNDKTASWATDGKWYNEAWDGLTVVRQETTFEVGLDKPGVRSAVLDPALEPIRGSQNDLFSEAFSSQFRLGADKGEEGNVVGTWKGKEVEIPLLSDMYTSKVFFIPNVSVSDLS